MAQAFRPISVHLGEYINISYSSLIKDLSFYEYIPLLCAATIVLVSLIMFLVLLFFGFEVSFLFNLVTLKLIPKRQSFERKLQTEANIEREYRNQKSYFQNSNELSQNSYKLSQNSNELSQNSNELSQNSYDLSQNSNLIYSTGGYYDEPAS